MLLEHIMRNYTQHFKTNAMCNIEIPSSLLSEWQSIVELIVNLGEARAGLIMRVHNDEIEVFVSSKQVDNPYKVGTSEPLLNSGLYCESVIKQEEMLFVPNALKSPQWDQNPDLKYGLCCYLGFPIKLPNGQPFGTICILDDKENDYSSNTIQLIEKMRDLIESHLKLLYISFHDALTNTYNRTYFNTRVEQEMKLAAEHKTPLTMLLLDLDWFKKINDRFGHLMGDNVLKAIANIMINLIKEPGIVVRHGGEEFIVLMPDTNINEAKLIAETIRNTVESSCILEEFKVTVSIGVAQWSQNESLDAWYKRADQALYKAKEAGRNRVVVDNDVVQF